MVEVRGKAHSGERMKTIVATITVADSKAADAKASLQKDLHVLAESLRLRNPSCTVGEVESWKIGKILQWLDT